MPTPRSNDWRASTRQASAGSKRTQGALLLLITSVLLVVVIFLLWQRDASRTYVVRAEVGGANWTYFDSDEFVTENSQVYDRYLKLGHPTDDVSFWKDYPDEVASGLEPSNQAATNKSPSDQDVLILHFRCHTTDFDNKPYLLGGQFANDFTSDSDVRLRNAVPLGSFLARINKLPHKTKLVILDGLRLPPSAWRGSLSNQFPSLAHEAMRGSELSENLWLILPTADHQQSRVSQVLGKSIFAKALELSLKSAESAKEVTLGGFYRKLRDHSNYLSDYQQTPQLYRGGSGHFVPDEEPTATDDAHKTVLALAKQATDDSEEDQASETQEHQESEPAQTTRREPSESRYLVVADTQGEEEPGESSPSQEPEKLTLAQKLWQLRDAAMRLTDEDHPLPLDYAPHYWRRLNLGLVKLEEAETATTEEFVSEDINEITEPLGQMYSIASQSSKSHSSDSLERVVRMLDMITQLRSKYQRESGQPPWTRSCEIIKRRRLCARQYSRALFAAQYYVQWYDRASVTQEIGTTKLFKFLKQLAKVKESLEVGDSQTASRVIDDVERGIRELEEAESAVSLMLTERLENHCNNLLAEGWNYRDEIQLQNLLALPVLSFKERQAARKALATIKKNFATSNSADKVEKYRTNANNGDPEGRMKKRIDLNASLIALVDSGRGESATESYPVKTVEWFHQRYRELAKTKVPAAHQDFLLANLCIRLADGRDQPDKQAISLPDIPGKIALGARTEGPSFVQSSDQRSGALTLQVHPYGDDLGEGPLWGELQFEAPHEALIDRLQVNGKQVSPREAFRLADSAIRHENHEVEMKLLFSDDFDPLEAREPIQGKLRISYGQPSKEAKVLHEEPLSVYGTSIFKLVAEQKLYGGRTFRYEETGPHHHLQLQAFPNRENVYSFGVRNLSGTKRKIEARLYRVKDFQRLAKAKEIVFGSAFHPETKELLSSFQTKFDKQNISDIIGTTYAALESFTLSPDSDQIHWLPLETPNKEASDKPTDSPSPSAPETGTTELPRGLLCEIRDITIDTNPPQKSYHWIGFTPRHPSAYFTKRRAERKNNGNPLTEITFDLDKTLLPHNVIDQPIQVAWHPLPQYSEALQVVDENRISLAPGEDSDSLKIEILNPDEYLPPLVVDVDSYPRAFRFESEGRSYQRKGKYITTTFREVTIKGEEPPTTESALRLGDAQNPLIRNKDSTLKASLQVEVPTDWHESRGDHVQIYKLRRGKHISGSASADRQHLSKQVYSPVFHQASFVSCKPSPSQENMRGELTIRLKVAPLQVTIHEEEGEFNGYVFACLSWRDKPAYQAGDSQEPTDYYFAVDKRSPKPTDLYFEDDGKVFKGEVATLVVEANDFGGTGVEYIQFHYGDLTKQARQELPPVPFGKGRLRIPTTEMSPGTYQYSVNLIDRAGNYSNWRRTQPKDNRTRISLEVLEKRAPVVVTPNIVEPPPPPPDPTYALRVKLEHEWGTKLLDADQAGHFDVTCSGQAMELKGSTFMLRELKKGSYKVEVEGELKGKEYTGKARVKMPPDKSIKIRLKHVIEK